MSHASGPGTDAAPRRRRPLVVWPEPRERRPADLRAVLVAGCAAGAALGIDAVAPTGGASIAVVIVGSGALVLWSSRPRRVRARTDGPDVLVSPPFRREISYGAFVLAFLLAASFAFAVTRGLAFGGGGAAAFWPAALTSGALLLFLAWVVFRGGVQVRLERVPYVLGERATFWVATTSGASRLECAEAILRCVGCPHCAECRDSSHQETLWWRRWVAPEPEVPGPDEFVGAAFELPRELPATSVGPARDVRWELLVAGRTRFGALMETFAVAVVPRT